MTGHLNGYLNCFRQKEGVTVRMGASRDKRQRHPASPRLETYGPKATAAPVLAPMLGLSMEASSHWTAANVSNAAL